MTNSASNVQTELSTRFDAMPYHCATPSTAMRFG